MALTHTTEVGTGVSQVYDIHWESTLGYLDRDHVYVYTGDDYTQNPVTFTWINDLQIECTVTGEFTIRRKTVRNELWNNYVDGAILTGDNLNDSFSQELMLLEEEDTYTKEVIDSKDAAVLAAANDYTDIQIAELAQINLGGLVLPYGVADITAMLALDVSKYTFAKVLSEQGSGTEYHYVVDDSTGIVPPSGIGSWVKLALDIEWQYKAGAVYASDNSFTLFGDYRAMYTVGRKVNIQEDTAFSTILSSELVLGSTVVTVSTNVVPVDVSVVEAALVGPDSLPEQSSGGSADYPTLASLLISTSLVVGDIVTISEYATGNGGGGKWRAVDNTTVTIDGYGIVQSTALVDVALELVHNGSVVAEQYGVVPDDTVNSSMAINAAIQNVSVRALRGSSKYLFEQQITLKSYFSINFAGAYVTTKDGMDSLFLAPAGAIEFSITKGTYQNTGAVVTHGQLTSFFIGEGNRVAGVNTYSKNYSISGIKLHGFNWIVDCVYSRTWNLTDFFSYGLRGIRTAGKCPEITVSSGIVFGQTGANILYDTHGFHIQDDPNGEGQYIEGPYLTDLVIDGFATCMEIESAYDMHVTSCWLGTSKKTDAHVLKFTQGASNFFRLIKFVNTNLSSGIIEFVSHSTPVTTAFVEFNGCTYQGHNNITIGQFWHDISFDGFTYLNDYVTGVVVAPFHLIYGNQRIVLNDIKFRGSTFTRLAQVYGNASSGKFSNFWCDEPIERPFYLESPIEIQNCPQGLSTLGDRIGPIIKSGQIPVDTYTFGENLVTEPLTLAAGTTIEVTIGGLIRSVNAIADSLLRISFDNASPIMAGTGWSSYYFYIAAEQSFCGTHKVKFKVDSSSVGDFKISLDNARSVAVASHTWYSVEYV